MLFEILLFVTGYIATTFAYYINHRFIFHGKLPPWTPGQIKKLHRWYSGFHLRHHLNAFPKNGLTTNVEEHLHVPIYAKIIACLMLLGISFFSTGLAGGVLTFFIVYGIRHGTIHGINVVGFKPVPEYSYYYKHHMSHHTKGNWTKYNFSGVHPYVDKIFKTYSSET